MPVLLITGQCEIPRDSIRGDKLLEQRSRELHVLSGGATNHDVPGGPAIIVQVLTRSDAEVEFVSVVHRV
jgi:hypothetical protein